jgi:hypothetical protein
MSSEPDRSHGFVDVDVNDPEAIVIKTIRYQP